MLKVEDIKSRNLFLKVIVSVIRNVPSFWTGKSVGWLVGRLVGQSVIIKLGIRFHFHAYIGALLCVCILVATDPINLNQTWLRNREVFFLWGMSMSIVYIIYIYIYDICRNQNDSYLDVLCKESCRYLYIFYNDFFFQCQLFK